MPLTLRCAHVITLLACAILCQGDSAFAQATIAESHAGHTERSIAREGSLSNNPALPFIPVQGSTNGPVTIPRFGEIPASQIVAQDDLFVVIHDKYPISPGHSLIIAKRAVARFQDLTPEEKLRLLFWIERTQRDLAQTLHPVPDAFNFGLNDGPAAGQTIPQLHFHIIPRYKGDVPDPRGGVRYVIPSKARYWDQR
jgi:diadenosine tetraphosphate (Ap4A) HIT family hydrolase